LTPPIRTPRPDRPVRPKRQTVRYAASQHAEREVGKLVQKSDSAWTQDLNRGQTHGGRPISKLPEGVRAPGPGGSIRLPPQTMSKTRSGDRASLEEAHTSRSLDLNGRAPKVRCVIPELAGRIVSPTPSRVG